MATEVRCLKCGRIVRKGLYCASHRPWWAQSLEEREQNADTALWNADPEFAKSVGVNLGNELR